MGNCGITDEVSGDYRRGSRVSDARKAGGQDVGVSGEWQVGGQGDDVYCVC